MYELPEKGTCDACVVEDTKLWEWIDLDQVHHLCEKCSDEIHELLLKSSLRTWHWFFESSIEKTQGYIEMTLPDNVNHPPHYKGNGIECIDVIEAFDLGFHLGNAIKYILRCGKKGDRIEDLKKAAWYLQREIESTSPNDLRNP